MEWDVLYFANIGRIKSFAVIEFGYGYNVQQTQELGCFSDERNEKSLILSSADSKRKENIKNLYLFAFFFIIFSWDFVDLITVR